MAVARTMSRAGGHRDEHLGPLATDRDDLARGRRLVNEIVNGSFVPLAQVRLMWCWGGALALVVTPSSQSPLRALLP
jgi:hypothetical protein